VSRTWIVVFWIMTPSNIMDRQQSFWRTYSLHLHDAPNRGRHGNRV